MRANLDIMSAMIDALVEFGELTGEQVDVVIIETVARRAAAVERQRRDDLAKRCANAATFE